MSPLSKITILPVSQACYSGFRVTDDGRACEGEGARTDPQLRGTGLYLFPALRHEVLRDVCTRWPQLRCVRVVTINVADISKSKDFRLLPYGMRV